MIRLFLTHSAAIRYRNVLKRQNPNKAFGTGRHIYGRDPRWAVYYFTATGAHPCA